jgi:hypothetical protein
MTETKLYQAHAAGLARLAVACPGVSRSWRSVRVASGLRRCGSALVLPTNGYRPNATIPAAVPAFMAMATTTKRPTRHLRTRTT